tara:strand:+ start:66 stop:464 length:399 start_codon:yes stop_codon:yes gene_type:complete
MSNNSFGLGLFIVTASAITLIIYQKHKKNNKNNKNNKNSLENILENYDNQNENSIFIPYTQKKHIEKNNIEIEKVDTEEGYISDDEKDDDPDGFDTINHEDIPKNFSIKMNKSESCTYKKIKTYIKNITYSL